MYLPSQVGQSWSRHRGQKSAGCCSLQHSHPTGTEGGSPGTACWGAQGPNRLLNRLAGTIGRTLQEYILKPPLLGTWEASVAPWGASVAPRRKGSRASLVMWALSMLS